MTHVYVHLLGGAQKFHPRRASLALQRRRGGKQNRPPHLNVKIKQNVEETDIRNRSFNAEAIKHALLSFERRRGVALEASARAIAGRIAGRAAERGRLT